MDRGLCTPSKFFELAYVAECVPCSILESNFSCVACSSCIPLNFLCLSLLQGTCSQEQGDHTPTCWDLAHQLLSLIFLALRWDGQLAPRWPRWAVTICRRFLGACWYMLKWPYRSCKQWFDGRSNRNRVQPFESDSKLCIDMMLFMKVRFSFEVCVFLT